MVFVVPGVNLLFSCFFSNNAGVMATPFMLSQDGIELQFATNHIGNIFLFLIHS